MNHPGLVERARRKRHWVRRQRRGLASYASQYLDWLSFANAGMLHPGHRYLFDLAVRELPTDDPVLEIGCFCGLSTNVITYFLEKHGRRNPLFTTDPWIFEGENGELLPESDIAFADYRRYVRRQFETNVHFWSAQRLPYALELASDDFFAAWSGHETRRDVFGREVTLGGPIAFCFIDGDHRHEQARRDFDHAERVLVSGGLIMFDDSDEFGAFPHLYELMQEVVAEGRYQLVAANPGHLLRRR